jgi:hypothetical protein
MTFFEVSINIVAAFLAALLALWFVALRKSRQRTFHDYASDDASTVLLFEGDALADATSSGESLLEGVVGDTDWARLERVLEGRFPGFPEASDSAVDEPVMVLDAKALDDTSQLRIEKFGQRWRVELIEPDLNRERSPSSQNLARTGHAQTSNGRRSQPGLEDKP